MPGLLSNQFVAVTIDFLRKKLGLEEGKKGKYPYNAARLSDASDDLTKQWVVVYYVFDVNADKLVRKRIGVTGATIEERKKIAAEYIKGINKLLESGYHIDNKKEPAKELPLRASGTTTTFQITNLPGGC